jgi:uncharacterized integral membrane protein
MKRIFKALVAGFIITLLLCSILLVGGLIIAAFVYFVGEYAAPIGIAVCIMLLFSLIYYFISDD